MNKYDWMTAAPLRVTTDTHVWLIVYKTGALWPAVWIVENQNFEVSLPDGTLGWFEPDEVACYTLRQPNEETPPAFVPVGSSFDGSGIPNFVYLFTDPLHRRWMATGKNSVHVFIHSSNVAVKS